MSCLAVCIGLDRVLIDSASSAHNGLFRIDPRVQGNKLVESQFKQYATKNDFSAATTTESGRVAVASNKGDIRLFDAIGKNAKVSLASGLPLP